MVCYGIFWSSQLTCSIAIMRTTDIMREIREKYERN